jgi:uncharacterized protein
MCVRYKALSCVFAMIALHLIAASAMAAAVPFVFLGEEIAPASTARVKLKFGESYAGDTLSTPVLIAHGANSGPTLCLTAAIHGDELNGIEAVRRVLHGIDPAALTGTVIGVPVVNLLAFTRGTRETPDRRDLNRYFPGKPDGSFAARIAHRLFAQVIQVHCDYLVDFHTGSFNRANLPQLRANLENAQVRRFARGFGETPALHKRGRRHMLRRVATEAGIPSVSFEFGEATTVQTAAVDEAVSAVQRVLGHLGMLGSGPSQQETQHVYGKSQWVRAERGGIFLSQKALGAAVTAGDVIGTIANPLTDEQTEILAPISGVVLGLASNQFVLPGYGVFNLAVPMSELPERNGVN